jgi:outer membrane protein OmpA-like peptidoglycan-associated protein
MMKRLAVLGGIGLLAALPLAAREPVPVDRQEACRRMFHWISAEEIRFPASSTRVSLSSHAVLERLVEFAGDCPGVVFAITGHTDDVGSAAYNQGLSEQRAAAVADFMEQRGVSRERLNVRGAGASEPIADNSTASGRERNRRIDIELVLPAAAVQPAGKSRQSPGL